MLFRQPLRVLTVITILAMASSLARANYDYSVVVNPPSAEFGGTSVSLAGRASTNLSGNNTISLAQLVINSTTLPTSADTILDNYTLTLTISNPALTTSKGVFTITGRLTGTVNATSSDVDNTYLSVTPSSQTIGNGVFQVNVGTLNSPDFFYQPATVNGANGGLGAKIVQTIAAPEPSSIGLLAGGTLLLLRRRRR